MVDRRRPADRVRPRSKTALSSVEMLPSSSGPDLFLNRELSWLAFNERVLEEAQEPSLPLLDRLRFLCIFSTNLDEFFMVRVARLRKHMAEGLRRTTLEGLSPSELYQQICDRVRGLTNRHQQVFTQDVLPALRREGIVIHRIRELDEGTQRELRRRFRREVAPVLTPMALDPGHPFPHLLDRGLNLILQLRRNPQDEKTCFAVIRLPASSVVPRFFPLGGERGSHEWVLLEDLVQANVDDLFPGTQILSCGPFRLTRNAELELEDDEEQKLIDVVEDALDKRPTSAAVRLQIPRDAAPDPVGLLTADLKLTETEIFRVEGPLDIGAFMTIANLDVPRLRRPDHFPRTITRNQGESIFRWIRRGDRLLHHPYESFDPVLEMVTSAAEDPKVLAIKQTLYRTGTDSPFVDGLCRAAQNGKQVTAVVELKARFDEHSNVALARRLEESGVHVIYGLLGLKIHCKALMVVRREDEGLLRRYAHIGSGNYHARTARLYTDVSYLSCDPKLTDDVGELFNMLTGYSNFDAWTRLLVAPRSMRKKLVKLIRREALRARRGDRARIVAKMNALEDKELIEELYKASQAGVRIDLVVRGICCLRPGIPGLSENIRVRSILGPFLEHSRAYYFLAEGAHRVFTGSADWMPRNMDRRIEVLVEVTDPECKERLLADVLEPSLWDNARSRVLDPDGIYRRLQPGNAERFDVQEALASGKLPKRIRTWTLVRGEPSPGESESALTPPSAPGPAPLAPVPSPSGPASLPGAPGAAGIPPPSPTPTSLGTASPPATGTAIASLERGPDAGKAASGS